MNLAWIGLLAALLLHWPGDPRGEREWRHLKYRGRTSYHPMLPQVGILGAESRGHASALLTMFPANPRNLVLRWRWRVLEHPVGADPEVRASDDRAAGVLVIVRRNPLLPWRTRALLYQWAPSRSRGEWSRSPFGREVHTVVLENAPADSVWRDEVRDLEADLVRAFGTIPSKIEAIGVISDADNTGGRAAAEFGTIEVLSGPEGEIALRNAPHLERKAPPSH